MQREDRDAAPARRRTDNPADGPITGRVDLAERVGQQVAVALAESRLVDLGRVPEIVPRAMARAQHDQEEIAALTFEQPGGDFADLIGALDDLRA